MKRTSVYLLTYSFLLWAASEEFNSKIASPPTQVELLRTGFFYKDTLSHQTGEKWFGLFKTHDGFELKETSIRIDLAYDPCSGDKENEKSGRLLSVDYPEESLILIRGLASLTEGPVKTVFSGNVFLYPLQSLIWNLGDQGKKNFYYIRVLGCAIQIPDRPNSMDIPLKDYGIYLSNSALSQPLCFYERVDPDSPPKILWAGDLDRDDKLDLIIDLSPGEFTRKYTLFLSGFAEEDELVKKVAEMLIESC